MRKVNILLLFDPNSLAMDNSTRPSHLGIRDITL